MPEDTPATHDPSLTYQLALISTQQKAIQRSLDRLESAVLGHPESGSKGLLTRMSVVEDRAEESHKRAGNAGKAATGGGMAAILALVLPLIRDMVGGK